MTTHRLPILDLRDFTHGEPARRDGFVTQLRDTAHRVGFFYLTGFGAAPTQAHAVLQAARVFFALPHTQKQALAMENSPTFAGTPQRARKSPAANATGGSNWTSALSGRPCRRPLQTTHGSDCRAPTNGRPACRRCSRFCWAGKPP